jgi:hypothetical protein
MIKCLKQQVLFDYNIMKSWISSMTNTLVINQVAKENFSCNVLHFGTLKQKMLNQPMELNVIATKVLLRFLSPVCCLPHPYFIKHIWWYPSMFCNHTQPCYECCKSHITCQMTCYIPLHKNPKTCITQIQNVIRYQKVKTNKAKGK